MEFRALKKQYEVLKREIDEAITKTISAGAFIGGAPVTNLEERLAERTGRRHCVSCGNGTDALELILRAWGVGEGDAVFAPDFTFIATAEPISILGAAPVFVDVYEDTFNINPHSLDAAINKVKAAKQLNPKAVIAVNLFGQTADYGSLTEITKKHGLPLFEDSAQSFGASYNGKPSCGFGDASATSFFPAKPLGCYGDGGAVFTDDAEKAAIIRSLAAHGKGADKYDNIRIGRNSRLDTIQAAILSVKLDAFEKYELRDINKAAAIYSDYLSDIKDVKTPSVPEGMYSSWAQYTIRLPVKTDRTDIIKKMSAKGIPVMVYYQKPLSKQTAFSSISSLQVDGCPVAEKLSDTVLSLPLHPYLTETEIQKVSDGLKRALS